jgi:hypothetical protein
MSEVTTGDVRKWAHSKGINVGQRGRIHPSIWAQYAAATGAEMPAATPTASATAAASSGAPTRVEKPRTSTRGRFIKASMLTNKDIHVSVLGRERPVCELSVDGDRITMSLMDEDATHIIKLDRNEMVCVL